MKNRIIKSTLAASLVFGSLTGLPLSAKGFGEQLGLVSTASAAASNYGSKVLVNSVAGNLWDEKAAVDAALTKLTAIDENDSLLIDAFSHKIFNKTGFSSTKYPDVTPQNMMKLIKAIGAGYDTDFTKWEQVRLDPTFRPMLQELSQFTGTGDITFNDLAEFQTAYQAAVTNQFQNKSVTDLLALANGTDMTSVSKYALDKVLTEDKTKFAQFLNSFSINSTDIITVKNNFAAKVDPDRAAEKALALAFVRSQTTAGKSAVSSDGRTMTPPALKVLSYDVPGEFVKWEAVNNSNISVDPSGKVTLNNSVTSGSATLQARILNKLIYKQEIILNAIGGGGTVNPPSGNSGSGSVNPPSSSGGGGAVVPPFGGSPALDVTKSVEKVNAVTQKLADLLKDNTNSGLAKVVQTVTAALREAAVLDLSKTVIVQGDVAKPDIDVNKLADVFKNVKDLAQKANELLKSSVPDAKPVKVFATLDLGTVNAKTSAIPIPKDLLNKAKENGIDALAIQVNGVSLTVDVDQLASDTTLTITKQDKAVAASATNKTVASDVFEFDFTSGGEKITNFSKPVEVHIPVTSNLVDTELLVLTKIDKGSLIFKGGKYDKASNEFIAPNKSFSTYAIIENKVQFTDTASVDEWAGRQITVSAAKGILEGRAEGVFVPNEQVTRAEFAKMIVKVFNLEDASAAENFSDVNTSDWFQTYVAAAVKAGIVDGRSADKFEPNAYISRAEMATMASRALVKIRDFKKSQNLDAALKGFVDADVIHPSLKEGVAQAASEGIVIGEENNKFNPNADSTRAQAAVVIYRLLNK